MQIPEQHRKITDFFGLKKSIVAVLSIVILIGLGEKMAERFLPLYLVALGGGTFSIGLLNGLDNLLRGCFLSRSIAVINEIWNRISGQVSFLLKQAKIWERKSEPQSLSE
jgi:hypothetical protein